MRRVTIVLVLVLAPIAAGCAAKKTAATPIDGAKNALAPTLAKPQSPENAVVARAQIGDRESHDLGPIYFEFNSHSLTTSAQQRLESIARYLRQYPTVTLTIEGHCDDRGTVEYNLALGDRRSREAVRYLRHLGVAESQLKNVSYGEERPAIAGDSEEAWSKNRRDEFVVPPTVPSDRVSAR